MTRFSLAVAAAAALLAAAAASPARAESAADFYKGRTVNLWIGFGAGGGDDLWGHIIARHMGAHLPGKATVVPQNMPGSAGLVVMNRLYNAAPKDGSVFGMVNRGIPFEPLLAGQGTQFDALKMNWIGSPNRDTAVCAARKDSAVHTYQDLFTHELRVGASGSGADTAVYPELLSNLLGMKFKVIAGYRGSRDVSLAMERNEVQGICVSYDSLAEETLFHENKLNILLQAAIKADPRLKDVPVATDLARTAADRAALQLFFARTDVGRPFVAPPGVPADRVAALRQAFAETLRDPAFLEEAKAQGLNVVPVSGEELHDIIAKAYQTPKDVVAQTIKALGRGS